MSEKPEDRSLAERARRELVQFKLIPQKAMLGGVCAALAYRIGCPTWLIRLLFLVLCAGYGVGFLPYLVLWFLVPEATQTPRDYAQRTGDTE